MSCPSVNVQASMRCGGVKYTYRVSRRKKGCPERYRLSIKCVESMHGVHKFIIHVVQKLCSVSRNYAMCP